MKINQNLSAMITNNQLSRTENSLTVAMERLSSGLKINHAKDDAAGMAISSQMQAQIDGIKRASQNASDGSSAIETADGALNEVTSMLQRMRELSVQASNGINAQEDKQAIQDEISSLTEEIDRISRDTEFNTKTLLNGDMDYRVYANTNMVSRLQASDEVPARDYRIDVKSVAIQAKMSGEAMNTTDSALYKNGKIQKEATISINGYGIHLEEGDTLDDVYAKLREGGEIAGVTVFPVDANATDKIGGYGVGTWTGNGNATLAFVSEEYGSAGTISIQCDDPDLQQLLGITQMMKGQATQTVYGEDAKVNIKEGNTFDATATSITDGNKVTVTDRNGFRLSFYVDDQLPANSIVNLEVTKIGALTLQIGARENQSIDVTIPEISSKSLYIDQVNVTKAGGADKAIATYDDALDRVLAARSKLGAYENRLDSAVASLDQTEENITQALSRITDVDMAEEMSEYTQYTVLSQAATSVLAQANDLPKQALQLLS